jgi:transposase-like protein
MSKDHIVIRCPECGARMRIDWPTPRARHAEITCPSCEASFPVAEAVERTVVGAPDHRDLHIVRNRAERPD